MATRKGTSAPSKRRSRVAEPPRRTFYPRDAQGRFIPLAEWRPRDKRGHFTSLAKQPKWIREQVLAARAERDRTLAAQAAREAQARSERARKAALALVEKRRRAREAREAERARELEEERLAAAAAAVVDEQARKKEEQKQKRKERRAREDEEIKKRREEAQGKLAEEQARIEREKVEAKRLAKEEYDRKLVEAEARAEEAKKKAIEAMPLPEPPPLEVVRPREEEPGIPVGPPGEETLGTGVVLTPQELMEYELRALRETAIHDGDLYVPQTDVVLSRNEKTGSLGQVERIGRMADEEGLVDDLVASAVDYAETILGVERGGYVYVSVQFTEWAPGGVFVGSIDRTIAYGPNGTLVTSWQSTKGKQTVAEVERAVRTVLTNAINARSGRVASLVEAIYVRGYGRKAPGAT